MAGSLLAASSASSSSSLAAVPQPRRTAQSPACPLLCRRRLSTARRRGPCLTSGRRRAGLAGCAVVAAAVATGQAAAAQALTGDTARLLVLSNGHGEDAIGAAVAAAVREHAENCGRSVAIEALPLVGLGGVYGRCGIPRIGPAQNMPSGGFLYMDRKQLMRDVQAGLVDLTLKQQSNEYLSSEQWRALREWVAANPSGSLLAVGDVFPLALAWAVSKSSSNQSYGFIGTAKSEFYLQDGNENMFADARDPLETRISPTCVYLPWERALIASSRCRISAPRDSLTAQVLKSHLQAHAQSKVVDLGNPMMDGLHPTGALDSFMHAHTPHRCFTLLPGSRAPEVYDNWRLTVSAARETVGALSPHRTAFVAPIVPSLPMEPFAKELLQQGWRQLQDRDHTANVTEYVLDMPGRSSTAVLALCNGLFNDCAHAGQAAIAMAGTATEQMVSVGLGKPAFTLAGKGPQFTYKFAEAQTRLLGESVLLCANPTDLAKTLASTMDNPERLEAIARNGKRRMGEPGSAARIAEALWHTLLDPSLKAVNRRDGKPSSVAAR
eukprot:jgi/Chlat1/7463/Chrsp6S07465